MESATTHRVKRQARLGGGPPLVGAPRQKRRSISELAGRGRLLADEVDAAVTHEQEVGNARGRRVVCRAEVRHEGVTVDEALAVEVADVRRAVDGHGARDEVMMASAEVVRPLVLRRRDRDDRLDARGEPAVVRCGEERRSGAPASPLRARMLRRYYGPGARLTSSPLTLRVQSSRRAPSDRRSRFPRGRIAQLVRAPASHAGGPWFKSRCDHLKIR